MARIFVFVASLGVATVGRVVVESGGHAGRGMCVRPEAGRTWRSVETVSLRPGGFPVFGAHALVRGLGLCLFAPVGQALGQLSCLGVGCGGDGRGDAR